MKKLPLIFLLITCFAFRDVRAQCAVYYEEESGICGWTWDNGKPPYSTMEEVKAAAKKACEDRGGKNCQLFYSGYEIGWWVVVRGLARKDNKDGHLFRLMLFKTENTPEAKSAAEKEAIKVFIDAGGIRPTNPEEVQSWYVPGKQE